MAKGQNDTKTKTAKSNEAKAQKSTTKDSAGFIKTSEVKSSVPKESKQGGIKPVHVALILGAIVLAVYLCGAVFFMNVFMPKSTLLGRDVSLRSASSVAEGLIERNDAYILTIDGDNFDYQISGKDIGLTFDADAYVKSAIDSTSPWLWPVSAFAPHDIEASRGVTFDQAKLTESLVKAVDAFNAQATPPTNATIACNADSEKYEVVPQKLGTQLNADAVQKAAISAIEAFEPHLTLGEAELQQATITSDDPALADAVKTADDLLSNTVTLDFEGQTIDAVTRDKLAEWIVLDADNHATLNQDAILDWGLNVLSPSLDTVGSERTYTRPDGKVITVKGGTYGWNISSANLADEIVSAVTSGGGNHVIQIPTKQAAEKLPDNNGVDFGSTYIDVDIAEQHARMYTDGNLVWESDIVSGNIAEKNGTPYGVYAINNFFNKKNPASTLIGKIDPETNEPEYRTPVKYWMPFVGHSIGFHDADWRSSFGGNIYTYNGSHGCINLPPEKAAELCNLIYPGLVVIVHG